MIEGSYSYNLEYFDKIEWKTDLKLQLQIQTPDLVVIIARRPATDLCPLQGSPSNYKKSLNIVLYSVVTILRYKLAFVD